MRGQPVRRSANTELQPPHAPGHPELDRARLRGLAPVDALPDRDSARRGSGSEHEGSGDGRDGHGARDADPEGHGASVRSSGGLVEVARHVAAMVGLSSPVRVGVIPEICPFPAVGGALEWEDAARPRNRVRPDRRTPRGGTAGPERRARPPRGARGGQEHAARVRARRRRTGMTVLSARSVETEAELALAGLSQVLWPILHLSEADSRAAAGGPGGGARAGPPARARGPFRGLRRRAQPARRRLRAVRRSCVLADDAHWLDRSSAEALTFSARRLGEEGVALIFARRDPHPGALRPQRPPRDGPRGSRRRGRRAAPPRAGLHRAVADDGGAPDRRHRGQPPGPEGAPRRPHRGPARRPRGPV